MAAPSNSVVLTQDLRAATQDYKRDAEHKHKWELGKAWGPGRQEPAHPCPRKPESKRKSHKCQAAKGVHRRAITNDRHESITDSSCEEEVEEPSAAPAPDADITYSFDSKQGPSHGSQILREALDKAVKQFESIATDKLVHDEYEILDSDGEPLAARTGRKVGKARAVTSNDDDDYEFV